MKINIAGIKGLTQEQINEINPLNREYASPKSTNIVININDAGIKKYQIPDLDHFKDKIIVGIHTRRQNTADNKFDKNGRKLISEALLSCAFLTLTQNNSSIDEKLPLEFLIHEPSGNAGTYYQKIIAGAFTTHSSTVEFTGTIDPSDVGRSVELIFHYFDATDICE